MSDGLKYSKVGDKTLVAVRSTPRYVSSCGGTRSGKTFGILQVLVKSALNDEQLARPAKTISVVSETYPHLRRGAIRDFRVIMEMAGIWDEDKWSKTESTYTFENGTRIEFFSADSPAKVHGAARDWLFINEAQNIPFEIARQLFVRTRGKVIVDYNPTHSFWVNEKIETDPDCISLHSTYQDNDFLTKEQIAEIERNKTDANWWRVYGEGKVGVLDGVIYDFDIVDALPDIGGKVETYGMDFGFTNDPSVLIHCILDTGRREIWLDEIFYQTGMLNADMAAAMASADVPRGVPVYADAAEPKTIADLCGYGYNVIPCYKATRKAEQIQQLRGYRIHITKQSVEAIREMRAYTWAKDKDGHSLNEPIPFNDHAMDAFRYGVFTHLAEGFGRYSFGFSHF